MTVKTLVFKRKNCFPPIVDCEKDTLLSVHPYSIRLYRKSATPTNIISSVDGSYLQVIRRDLVGSEQLNVLLEISDSVREMMVDITLDGWRHNCFIDNLLARVIYSQRMTKHAMSTYRTEVTVDIATGDMYVSVPYIDDFKLENEEILCGCLED